MGLLGPGRSISRQHAIIEATELGFTVSATGSQIGVIVSDRTTPSRLYVPCGMRSIDVPFASSYVTVETGADRPGVRVDVAGSPRAERWRAGWTAENRERWRRERDRRHSTQAPWRDLHWARSNESVYAWFRTLVALCEPVLAHRVEPTPTNRTLAGRLHTQVGVIERHMAEIYENLGLSNLPSRDREIVVAIAVGQGIVTPDDLELLEERV